MGMYGKGDREEMVRLNEKLAVYMQKVRTLGSGDSVVFLDTLRSIEDEVKKLKTTYERELDKCRQHLEEANRQKNDAESESEKRKRVASDLEDWYRVEKDKNGRLLCDINQLQVRVADLEKELTLTKAASQGPQQQLSAAQCELNKEKSKSQELANALDCEKARCKQLQDKCKELQSQVEFSGQLNNETTREANNRLVQAKKVISDLESKNRDLQRRNDGLPQLLEQMRKKTEQDLQNYQKDVENSNKRNTEALKKQLDEQSRSMEQLRADNAKLERENLTLMTRLSNMEGQIQDLNNQKANLESQICQERSRCSDQIKSLEMKLKDLQDQLLAKMQEINAGKDIQVCLKGEIEAYRVLLEEEEKRLGSPMGRAQSRSGCVKPSSGLSGRGSGMDKNRRTKTPSKGGAGGTVKYEARTEYQSSYNKFGRSTFPRIDNSQSGGFTTGRTAKSPNVRGSGNLANSCNGNMRAFQRMN